MAHPPVILQVLPAMEQGGAEQGCLDVAAAVAEASGRALVASSGGTMAHRLGRAGAEHLSLPLARKAPWALRSNAEAIAGIIKAYGVSIIHARSRAPAWSALWAAQRTGVPFITTFHSVYSLGAAPIRPFKRRYNGVMTRGRRVIAVSHYVAGYIAGHYGTPRDRIRIIPRGIDLGRFDPAAVTGQRIARLAAAWHLPNDKAVILMPGRIAARKGHETLIAALARLGRGDVRAVFVGAEKEAGGYRARLEKAARQAGVADRIQFVGACDDMAAAYRLATVVAAPSLTPEAFGRVPVEALAMGRPVVATDTGAFTETLQGGKWGRLVPPGDAAALAGALGAALNDGLDDAWGAAARAHVAAFYTTKHMTDATLDLYEEVLRENAAR